MLIQQNLSDAFQIGNELLGVFVVLFVTKHVRVYFLLNGQQNRQYPMKRESTSECPCISIVAFQNRLPQSCSHSQRDVAGHKWVSIPVSARPESNTMIF